MVPTDQCLWWYPLVVGDDRVRLYANAMDLIWIKSENMKRFIFLSHADCIGQILDCSFSTTGLCIQSKNAKSNNVIIFGSL